MALDKLFHKIQTDITELARSLEFFLEDSIQPTVDECEDLQKKLTQLQEHLAVYKHFKLDKELSPSFMIHAKVSEKEPLAPAPVAPAHTDREPPAVQDGAHQPSPLTPSEEALKRLPPLAIGLNDKFRLINELFAQNASEYGIAVEQLNNLRNWTDTEIYLNSLRDLYGWRPANEVVKYLYGVAKKRFD